MNRTLWAGGAALCLLTSGALDVQAGHRRGKHGEHARAPGPSGEELLSRIEALEVEARERDAAAQTQISSLEAEVGRLNHELGDLRKKEMEDVKALWKTPDAKSWLKSRKDGDVTIGGSFQSLNITGGEQPLFQINSPTQSTVGPFGTVFESGLDEDEVAEWRFSYALEDHASINAKYRNLHEGSTVGFIGQSAAVADVLLPLAHPATPGGLFTSALGGRLLDVSDGSLEVERRVVARKRFALNVFGGIRTADIDDSLGVDGNINVAAPAILGTRIRKNSEFVGVGPSAGIKGRWALGKKWELQGSMGMAALVGRTNFSLDQQTILVNRTVLTTASSQAERDSVVPVLDLGSRLVWHAGDSLSINVGYDLTRYFDATFDRRFADIVGTANVADTAHGITLDGVTAGLDWTF